MLELLAECERRILEIIERSPRLPTDDETRFKEFSAAIQKLIAVRSKLIEGGKPIDIDGVLEVVARLLRLACSMSNDNNVIMVEELNETILYDEEGNVIK